MPQVFIFASMDKNSMEKLAEASAAEAEAATAVWQAVQSASAGPAEETSVSDDNSQVAETISEGSSDTEADVRLHPRAVCIFCAHFVYYGFTYFLLVAVKSCCFRAAGCSS